MPVSVVGGAGGWVVKSTVFVRFVFTILHFNWRGSTEKQQQKTWISISFISLKCDLRPQIALNRLSFAIASVSSLLPLTISFSSGKHFSEERECISAHLLPVLHHIGVPSAVGANSTRHRTSVPTHQHHPKDDPAQWFVHPPTHSHGMQGRQRGAYFINHTSFVPETLAEKTNMYVTRLPSLRNINRVVDELGNGRKSEQDPSKAPTISILTQCKAR